MISYRPFFKTLKNKGITQYFLQENGVSRGTLDSLKNNRNITLLTVENLCKLLECQPNDIYEFIDDDSNSKKAR